MPHVLKPLPPFAEQPWHAYHTVHWLPYVENLWADLRSFLNARERDTQELEDLAADLDHLERHYAYDPQDEPKRQVRLARIWVWCAIRSATPDGNLHGMARGSVAALAQELPVWMKAEALHVRAFLRSLLNLGQERKAPVVVIDLGSEDQVLQLVAEAHESGSGALLPHPLLALSLVQADFQEAIVDAWDAARRHSNHGGATIQLPDVLWRVEQNWGRPLRKRVEGRSAYGAAVRLFLHLLRNNPLDRDVVVLAESPRPDSDLGRVSDLGRKARKALEELPSATILVPSPSDRLGVIEDVRKYFFDCEKQIKALAAPDLAALESTRSWLVDQWLDFRKACVTITKRHLGTEVRRNVVSRPSAEQHVLKFIRSTDGLLPILGESGMGKTCLLDRLSQLFDGADDPLSPQGEPVSDNSAQGEATAFLYYTADAFNEGGLRQISRDLISDGVPNSEFSDTVLPRNFKRFERKCVIAIDALNTSQKPIDLLQHLQLLLREGGDSLKVVVTCQPSAWTTLLQNVGGPDQFSPSLSVGQYTHQEAQNAICLLSSASPVDAANALKAWKVRDPLLVGLFGRHIFCDSAELMTEDTIPALLAHLPRAHPLSQEDIQFLSQGLAAAILNIATVQDPRQQTESHAGLVALSAFRTRDRAALGRLEIWDLVAIRHEQAGFSHERLRDYFLGQRLLQQRVDDPQPNSFYRRALVHVTNSGSRLVLQGALRNAVLTDLAKADDALPFVDMAFVDPAFEPFMVEAFQMSDANITRLGVPLKILERAISELTAAGEGKASALNATDRVSAKTTSLSAARVALETAQRLGDEKTLVRGLSCRHFAVRALAVQAVARLSRRDWGIAVAALRQALLKGWPLGLFPRRASVESCLALTVLLMSELPNSQDARRPERVAGLREIWMRLFRRYSFGLRNPISRFLRGWILDRITAMVKERADESERYNAANLNEVARAFALLSQDSVSYLRLVDALEATTVNMARVKDHLCASTARRDIISTFVVGALFARQFLEDPLIAQQMAEAVAASECGQGRNLGPNVGQIIWGLYVALRKEGFKTSSLLDLMNLYIDRHFSASSLGEWQAATGQVYVSTFSDVRIIAAVEFGLNPLHADVQQLLRRAVEEYRQHPDFIRDILYDFAKLSRDPKYHGALLANLEWLVAQPTVKDVEAITNIIATIRQENPVLVDQALLLWNVPSDRVDRITNHSVHQSIGEDLMWGNLSLGFGDVSVSYYLDPELRPLLIQILRAVADGRDLRSWIAFSAATVTNATLGMAYFPETDD